ncbi:hypothetical protein EAE96_005902 [Botrytis aclada]|nr:hypothetical protein EAE96_005902 [Botrytis aclada]
MSQVQPRAKDQPDSYDQSDAQDQPQIGDQPQAPTQTNRQSSSQSQLDIDADDFTFFSKLPLELQRKIWEFAAVPQSRAIQIETICERDAEGRVHTIEGDDDDDEELVHWSPTNCSPTPLLGICRESRSIAMKYYKYSSFLDRPLFYNPDLDTLWVRGNPLFPSVTDDPPSETTLEVLFWQRRYTELGPYLFRSVALDFAGIKKHQKIAPSWQPIPQDPCLCTLYAISKTEVEKVYIVYSSRDCRDDVEQEEFLRERNERDGTSLTEWKMPTVEAILDARLLNPIETFHSFPNLPFKLQRAIWNFAAIPHYRAIQIYPKFEGTRVESNDGRIALWKKQVTSPCYSNALFETCRESRHIAITKYDHSEVHTISTQGTEKSVIPRRFYYNADNDIMRMTPDCLRKNPSAGDGILQQACFEKFANIAVDIDSLFLRNLPQGEVTDTLTWPFLDTVAPKKLYLVYSRADQKNLAARVLYSLLDHMKSNEGRMRESFDSITNLEGIERRPWTLQVIETILESDLFEVTKYWRNNIIVK